MSLSCLGSIMAIYIYIYIYIKKKQNKQTNKQTRTTSDSCEWLKRTEVCCNGGHSKFNRPCPFAPSSVSQFSTACGTLCSSTAFGPARDTRELMDQLLGMFAQLQTVQCCILSRRSPAPQPPHHITPHHTVPHHIAPHCTTLHYTILYHTAPHHIAPHYTIPHRIALHYNNYITLQRLTCSVRPI